MPLPPLAFLSASTDSLNLPLQMLIVFGCAQLLAELSERLRMPGIVGGLLAIDLSPGAPGSRYVAQRCWIESSWKR